MQRMAAAIAILAVSSVAPMSAGNVDENCSASCRAQLSQAREGTNAYHEEAAALMDGFVPAPVCVAMPGVGGMGFHYVNPPRLMNLTVNAAEPEVVLYERQANGKMRLVGVEYFAPVLSGGAPWFGPGAPPSVDNPPPVLFGRTFNGPMAGHEPGMPWHYDLHAWIWRHNPAGMFADFNPNVVCQ